MLFWIIIYLQVSVLIIKFNCKKNKVEGKIDIKRRNRHHHLIVRNDEATWPNLGSVKWGLSSHWIRENREQVAHVPRGSIMQRVPGTWSLHSYVLRRKEPLYNPRWPPPQRGLLLANTKREAPPWLMARDGMIYWLFCLFAPAAPEQVVPTLARYVSAGDRLAKFS